MLASTSGSVRYDWGGGGVRVLAIAARREPSIIIIDRILCRRALCGVDLGSIEVFRVNVRGVQSDVSISRKRSHELDGSSFGMRRHFG